MLYDPNWHVRSMAVTALWQIGSERAVHALVDVLQDTQWLVHWKAAYALGKIGTTDVLPVLSRLEKATNPFLSEVSQKVLTSLDIVADPKRLSRPRLEYCSEDPYTTMSYIPAGEFIMGHDNGPDNAQPAHQMALEGFFIDTYEVTNYQYKRFDPSYEYPPGKESYPVMNVSWEEANAYAEWIGKRLPTEAEWEKAARGNDGRKYPWGNEFDLTRCNTAESGNRRPTSVDGYSTGRSPYGVYDMSGNVLEWTADRYKAYPWSRYDSPDFEEDFIVLRGGSWLHPEINATCSSRLYAPAENRSNFIGFRCVKDVHTLKR
jgi:formylglycine-generating enzyme required for sulfatase activity